MYVLRVTAILFITCIGVGSGYGLTPGAAACAVFCLREILFTCIGNVKAPRPGDPGYGATWAFVIGVFLTEVAVYAGIGMLAASGPPA